MIIIFQTTNRASFFRRPSACVNLDAHEAARASPLAHSFTRPTKFTPRLQRRRESSLVRRSSPVHPTPRVRTRHTRACRACVECRWAGRCSLFVVFYPSAARPVSPLPRSGQRTKRARAPHLGSRSPPPPGPWRRRRRTRVFPPRSNSGWARS